MAKQFYLFNNENEETDIIKIPENSTLQKELMTYAEEYFAKYSSGSDCIKVCVMDFDENKSTIYEFTQSRRVIITAY